MNIAVLRGFFVGLALIMAPLGYGSVPNQAAFDLVQTTQDAVLARVVENRELYLADEARYFQDIEALLGPFVDFKRIARRVMAKYYKNATDEQRERFAEVFKDSLMKIYSKGLLEYDNQRLEVLPPRTSKKVDPRKQRVDVELYSGSGAKFPITYSMYLAKDQQWKIENVVVNGINIGLTYRNQFSRLMKVNRNDIDSVIQSWTSQVTESE